MSKASSQATRARREKDGMLIQSLRMTLRDWRAGELRFLLIALIVAVAALSSVGFFVDRMRTGLSRDAHQLLGADLVISADQPISDAWRVEASRRGLTTVETVALPSMAIAGYGDTVLTQLVAVKAVTHGYPLRGNLKILAGSDGTERVTRDSPPSGTVWVDRNLLPALNLSVGGNLRLGDKTFQVAEVIAAEPDRDVSFVNFSPRVMLSLSDLAATNLIQDGSRVTYRLMVAGKPDDTAAMQQWAEQKIKLGNIKGMRLESLESGRPEMKATLDRADQFLSLVGLLSAMLAAIAIAMAARRFMVRHVDACAMLRCLGLTQRQVTLLYLTEFLSVGLVGSLLGVACGFAAHFVLLEWLGKLVTNDLPAATLLPAWQGLATGMVLLIGFAIPPILQLSNVPHNRIVRREQVAPKPFVVTTYTLGLFSFFGLLLWQAGNLKLGFLTAAGFVGGLALFALIGWLSLKGLRFFAWYFPANGLAIRDNGVAEASWRDSGADRCACPWFDGLAALGRRTR